MNFLCEGLCQRKVFPNMKPPWKGVLESLVGCFVPTGTAYVSLELLHSIAQTVSEPVGKGGSDH